ncbi:MAG: hypothetical protein SOT71_03895 [Romboutsia timonensis]|uniref:hypothetical protein n=1 Tax=Romboutsia timonensis TaxID=1776391 RepID=UPI002A748846|nr:hypothetical protein [Romboutsia timonensis]MDY2881781.1 hypothetical protein [Romboutsia timonensis]
MLYNIYFDNENEIEKIIEDNSNLYLIKITYDKNGNYLTFSENKNEYIPTLEEQLNEITKEQGEKISILEAENETLKQELSITQDAVNELIFNSLNM